MTAVVRIETGIAVSEMTVVRQFRRNANRTTVPKQNLIRLDALGQRGGDVLEGLLDLARQADGVDMRLLLHRDDNR
jgi:hypothetical protein